MLRAHRDGNIHQLLKSGRCRGIISLNSNVVHDGILWNVPSVVLGRNIWPADENGPFLRRLPSDWRPFLRLWHDPVRRSARDAYAWYLVSHQWTLDDARDPSRVSEVFRGMRCRVPKHRHRVVLSRAAPTRVNVVAANEGRLVEDLKTHFRGALVTGADIIVTDRARRDVDAWIFLRASEAGASPDPQRTVVQIHDLADARAYEPGGERSGVAAAGAFVLTHPSQRERLAAAGISCDDRPTLCRPLGALRRFALRAALPQRFSIGWVGRRTDDKRPEYLLAALDAAGGAARRWRVVLIGEGLNELVTALARRRIDIHYVDRRHNPVTRYPRQYQEMDALLITDRVAAGPNALFEALATGVAVVGTPVGWVPDFVVNSVNGTMCESPVEMARALEAIAAARGDWFGRREQIRRSLGDRTLEDWIVENVSLALQLADRPPVGGPLSKATPYA